MNVASSHVSTHLGPSLSSTKRSPQLATQCLKESETSKNGFAFAVPAAQLTQLSPFQYGRASFTSMHA